MALRKSDSNKNYSELVNSKIQLVPNYKPNIMLSYPHLLDADTALMTLYLQYYGHLYEGFAYDVRVGEGIDAGNKVPPNIRWDYKALTMKRIDAVGFMRNILDIIEIKPRATFSTVGQVLVYKALFNSTYANSKHLRAVIVTSSIDDDVYNAALNMQILVYRFTNALEPHFSNPYQR